MRNRSQVVTAVAVLIGWTLAWAPVSVGAQPEPATSQVQLPAWETEAEKRVPGKADKWDDYRESHPELFGVTAPPVVNIRPFAEYEPTQAVLMRPSGSISKFHRGIIEGTVGHVDTVVFFHVTGQVEKMLDQVESWDVPTDSIEFVDVEVINANWTRDYGPLSVVSETGAVGLVDFRYYHSRAYDDAVPSKLAANWNVNVFRPSMSFEGGNFMADTHGTCFVTQKLFNQNAGYTKEQVETWMEQYLGCIRLVAVKLPKKLGTGHIDMFAKLMDDTNVIVGYYDPEDRPENAEILDDNADIFSAVTTESGNGLVVHRIPLPWDESEVWFTYTNSLIVNDTVLVPVYDGFEDLEEEALAVYQAAAPHLSIYPVNSDKIIPAGGAIHCVTMTVPKGELAPFQDEPPLLCEFNEFDKCEGIVGCDGLLLEGICEDGLLRYCGADGYPHGQSCDHCCGWDSAGNQGDGWYDCLDFDACGECENECQSGQSGCSFEGTHSFECGEFDVDGCLERKYEECTNGDVCLAEAGECAPPGEPCVGDECPEVCEDLCHHTGTRQCTEDLGAIWTCRPDALGCLGPGEPEPCPGGTVCFDGVCRVPPEDGVADAVFSPEAETAEPEEPPQSGDCGCVLSGGGRMNPCIVLLVLLLILLTRTLLRASPRLRRTNPPNQAVLPKNRLS